MAALHKFKLFASHCGVAQSPTQSPRASPLVQLRRPKTTLRTLLSLSLSRSPRPQEPPLLQDHVSLEKQSKDLMMRRHSLKDLFVSSPPREEADRATAATLLGSVGVGSMGLSGPGPWRDGPGSSSSVWRGFRCRSLLKRKANWRPLLLTIPEDDA
ncbi:hypothetical protein HN51_056745 [Arachis hypogaea]|uniref:Uncharacterized protein n=1 Tax=Arachis hypogaea TaxID=3818 RepID=A0A444XV06_ARAHY|nr:uncharacterized protein LOC107616910 [Arachis ipaensis]XP_025679851.1 uncharacterized protein LOC112779730 [Arachis hypogaea]RYQ93629.1 hypothetical protein Ahy_B09g099882 [Arachis hypogaea]